MRYWGPILVMLVLSVAAIATTRPRLGQAVNLAKEQAAVYRLPPPNVLAHAALGYRAAVADYLWAHVLVTQGLRMEDRRPFTEVVQYLDAINYLEPRFREPYRFVDSLLSFQVNDPDRQASIREARRIMERGLAQFPYDSEQYLNYGRFLSYLGPGHLPEDTEERNEWLRTGAKAIARAGELSSDELSAFKAVSAATALKRVGEEDAAISFLERLYTVTDNDEVREDIVQRLRGLWQGRQASLDFELSREFDTVWRQDLPFAPRSWLSLLGPPHETWKCAGPRRDRRSRADDACINSWSTWSEHVLRQRELEP